ncbi:hypothetical protein Goshw_016507 [Gossypium schwendimanii]|uniref:Uncharacterized protein n=1 Tax=Gossypium schwendimanii TaxID=34291 RepID=A0A7J9MYW4_GOSSC|nr:hypothetical protein [Gossypium schwendimanii]
MELLVPPPLVVDRFTFLNIFEIIHLLHTHLLPLHLALFQVMTNLDMVDLLGLFQGMMITAKQGMVMVVVVVELVNGVAELEVGAGEKGKPIHLEMMTMLKVLLEIDATVVVVYGGAPINQQKMASDFLAKYIFMAMNRVGSVTGFIVQRVEFFHESDGRSRRMDTFFMLRKQMVSKARYY